MLDFGGALAFRDGFGIASLQPTDGWQIATGDTRRRVRRSPSNNPKDPFTIVLCDERGRCNPLKETPWDVVQA